MVTLGAVAPKEWSFGPGAGTSYSARVSIAGTIGASRHVAGELAVKSTVGKVVGAPEDSRVAVIVASGEALGRGVEEKVGCNGTGLGTPAFGAQEARSVTNKRIKGTLIFTQAPCMVNDWVKVGQK